MQDWISFPAILAIQLYTYNPSSPYRTWQQESCLSGGNHMEPGFYFQAWYQQPNTHELNAGRRNSSSKLVSLSHIVVSCHQELTKWLTRKVATMQVLQSRPLMTINIIRPLQL